MTEPQPLQQVDRTFVRWRGRRLSYFSGCDYFRLASHPRVIAALCVAAKGYGLSVSASRMTTGNHALYLELEKALADFFKAPDALLVSSGALTGLVVAQTLAGSFSHALIDELSHPTLVAASQLLDCPVLRFKHRDVDDLERRVRRCGREAKFILLTDGMFARDGGVAPLARYLKVLPPDALLLVDDAHGAGVLGEHGRGSLEHEGVNRRRFIQTITLSKAFGAYGGAILGSRVLRRRILERSPLCIGTTPIPLPIASAALQALELLRTNPGFKNRLEQNTRYLKDALRKFMPTSAETPGPILALIPREPAAVPKFKSVMLKAGIFPPFIDYPGAPDGGFFRFVISSEHTRAQLDTLLEVLVGFPSCSGLQF